MLAERPNTGEAVAPYDFAYTVDGYLAQLNCRLRGPGRWRRRILAETADGLSSAVETLAGRTGDRSEAERRAVAGWGCPVALAAEFNVLTDSLYSRRAAQRILGLVPVLVAAWAAVLCFGPGITWRQPEPAVIEVGPVVLGGGILAMVGSATAIIAVQRRYVAGAQGRVCRGAIALACAGALAAVTMVVILVCYRAAVAPATVSWPLFAGPLAASLCLLGLTGLDAAAMVRAPVVRR
jgi:hypothetical protein